PAAAFDRLERALAELPEDPLVRAEAAARLTALLAALGAPAATGPGGAADPAEDDIAVRIGDVSNDDIFDFIDNELGIS
ncbi:hypothetical protein, partial [Kitasatospora sp. MBT63]|uniref:hypothetical protein n=1 Tax=Kitasatospora sp. MBT63 TaxID=1444768 RepID=UPI0018F3057F